MSWAGSNAPVWDTDRLRIATDAAGVALWSWNIDTDEIALDERAHGLWGMPEGNQVTFQDLSARMHPADLERVRLAFKETQALTGPYEIDFRIQFADDFRWISARGQGGEAGIVNRVLFAIFLDVTERKQAEEIREMLASEMSHRVKNLFAIASALTTIAARSTSTTAEMAEDLTQRLGALGRAHDLVRPVAGARKPQTPFLGDLLAVLLAPYAANEAGFTRVHVFVPEIPVGEAALTTLALVIHELATNAIKYGALSSADGVVSITCPANDTDVVIVWTERGGPPVTGPRPTGFGSKLITQAMAGQLGGKITIDWPVGGVVVTMAMAKLHLAT